MIHWEPALGVPAGEKGLPPFAVAKKQSVGRAIGEIPLLLVMAGVIAFLVKSFVAQAFYIPSESMTPQLLVNDRVVVSKISYRLHEPRRGDIVVFDNPAEVANGDENGSNFALRFVRGIGEAVGVVQPSTEEFIKRVIALPGETVEGKDGRVYIDGRLLDEPYLPPGTVTTAFSPRAIPPDRLWVMGDNRGNSADSRVFGPIARDTVIGRAVLRVWPLGRTGFL